MMTFTGIRYPVDRVQDHRIIRGQRCPQIKLAFDLAIREGIKAYLKPVPEGSNSNLSRKSRN